MSPSYPSDLTDAQWKRVEPKIPKAKPGGRPRSVDMRQVLNAILYLSRTGCSWRMLPHDFPPWGTVHYYFRKWRRCGVWKKIHDALCVEVRLQSGREGTPSALFLKNNGPAFANWAKAGLPATPTASNGGEKHAGESEKEGGYYGYSLQGILVGTDGRTNEWDAKRGARLHRARIPRQTDWLFPPGASNPRRAFLRNGSFHPIGPRIRNSPSSCRNSCSDSKNRCEP